MSRPRTSFAVAAVTILSLVAACSDTPLAPSSAPNASLLDSSLLENTLQSAPILGGSAVTDSGTYVFSVGQYGGKYGFGNGDYRVDFPANAICNPATSSYGPTEWAKPCQTLTSPITITATYKKVGGHPQVTFKPDLRFAPTSSTSSSDVVMLYMKDRIVDESLITSLYKIYWTPSATAVPVDESLLDPSVGTKFKDGGWSVYRRVKHFSGYQVGSGNGGGGGEGGY